jgi:hypothetical protein
VLRLARGDVDGQPVMTWSCPVPYFGRLRQATVATVGINPSNREFVDAAGNELDGPSRRFPTLRSLGIQTWEEASSLDLAAIVSACEEYFSRNPYSRWFDVLDGVVQAAGVSYYSADNPAVHLDLTPYVTQLKWGALRPEQQRALLSSGSDLMAAVLRDSNIRLVVLNGISVVRQFETVAGVELTSEHNPGWDLPRRQNGAVRGIAFSGSIDHIGEVSLGRSIDIVGFNHNLQSSFGVTRRATAAIAEWIAER